MRRQTSTKWAAALVVLSAPTALAGEPDAVPASAKVVGLVDHVAKSLRDSRYSHAIRVDERAGYYEFDCSGMMAWMLVRAAPKAHGAVVWRAKSGRPLARDYYGTIAATKPGGTHYGWSRVTRVADARPGDVIAWLRPKEVRSSNTGHVAVVVSTPEPAPEVEHGYLVRIADASRYQHQDDTRTSSGKTGFGMGTILVVADPETGAPVAYGWVGTQSAWILATSMAIGRVER